jgi:hypothetical protein
MPAGVYTASLVNAAGQVLFTNQWEHKGGYVTRQFILPALSAGFCQLIIQEGGLKKHLLPVEIISGM